MTRTSTLVVLAGAVLAQAAGVPVSGVAAAAAMLAFAFGAMLIIVGANQQANRLFGVSFACIGAAILLPMLGAVIRDPKVLAVLAVTCAALVIVGATRAVGALYAALPEPAKPRKRAQARRARVVEGKFDESPELPRASRTGDDYDFTKRSRR